MNHHQPPIRNQPLCAHFSLSDALATPRGWRWGLSVAATLSIVCLGCAGQSDLRPDRATVSGTVTFDGRPLTGGTISFTAQDSGHRGASGMIGIDGRYRVADVPIGPNVVTINTTSIKLGNPSAYVAIPDKYQHADTSGLQADVESGDNRDLDFALD